MSKPTCKKCGRLIPDRGTTYDYTDTFCECSGAAHCSAKRSNHQTIMKTKNNDWRDAESAPKDRKILGFFEDIGWQPACWSESAGKWSFAYCAGKGIDNMEPEWLSGLAYESDLCWWREWPSNRWQDCPAHAESEGQND